MQSISGYLYYQTIELVINLDPMPNRENQLVYAKPLQLFKGIDNKVKLLFKNQDQKLQSLLDTQIIFNLIDSATRELVFSRRIVPTINRGQAFLVLNDRELDDLATGIYNYSVQLITGEDEYRIVYADDNHNAQGQARLNDGVYPRFEPSLEPNLGPFYSNPVNSPFGYSSGNVDFTNMLEVRNRTKARSVIQTAQYYGTNFTGSVEIQASLTASMAQNPGDWFTVDTLTFDNFNGCMYNNFTGNFSIVRFKITTDSGKLDKILYRP